MKKSGHKDVASSIRLCRNIIEDAENIIATLPEGEAELPTWWTNKLAICYAYINSLRDYIIDEDLEIEEQDEKTVDIAVSSVDEAMIPPSAKIKPSAS
jgi:hypothetical protein